MPSAAYPDPVGRTTTMHLIAPVVTAGFASLLLIAYLLWVSHGEALREAENTSLNYAKILETRVEATLRRVDGLLVVAEQVAPEQAFAPQAESRFAHINVTLNALVTNFPEAVAGRLFDTTGQLRYTSGAQTNTQFNFSDRDWFKAVMAAPAGTTIISQTHIGRISKEPSIVVARALRDEKGSAYGIAVVPLSLNVFQKLFEDLHMGPGGAISLRRADNHSLLVRWPHLPDEVNKPLKASNPVAQRIEAGQAAFTVHISAQTDGTRRIYGVNRIKGQLLYVSVGITRDSALAQWRRQALAIGSLGVALVVVVVIALRQLWVNETQRLRVQDALSESEGRLAGVIHSAMDAIISIDDQHKIVLFNRAAQRMFDQSEAAMLGQPMDALIPPQFRDQHAAHLRSFATEGAAERHMGASRQLFGLRSNGAEFPIEASISRFQSRTGWQSTVILRDITQRKAAEAALARSQQDLTRSNADLQQFAYAASHDLIEPLRSVAGSVQLLQKRYAAQLDAGAVTLIAHAANGAMRMQTLVQDLLTFSRVASQQSQAQDIAMDAALSDAVKNLEVAIAQSDAKITHDPLPHVMGHSTQITQLLQNLLANAIKFRGNKAALVHVGVRQEGDQWVFSVADQGIGIEAKYFARVFELFKRLHTREEYEGTGIGLALCKKIVERHDGRIWVESEPGQGTCFFFSLPVAATV